MNKKVIMCAIKPLNSNYTTTQVYEFLDLNIGSEYIKERVLTN